MCVPARSSEFVDPQSQMELVEEEEILRFRTQMLKKVNEHSIDFLVNIVNVPLTNQTSCFRSS